MRIYIHSFRTQNELDLTAVSNSGFSLASVRKLGLNLKVAESPKASSEDVLFQLLRNFKEYVVQAALTFIQCMF